MLRQRILTTASARRVITPTVSRIYTTVARRTALSPLRPTITRTPVFSSIRTPKPQFRVLATKKDAKPLQQRSKLVRALYKTFTFCGFATLTIGGAVVAFFVYDASTYKEDPDETDLAVPQMALAPRIGGPKNLPIAEILVSVLFRRPT
jgi:NADH dehydrogenase